MTAPAAGPGDPAAARPSLRPAVLAWALLALVFTAPYLRARLLPPPGTAFVGAFYFPSDVYNYLGYAQQAQDGAFLFRNKLTLEPHRPALVNIEWWLVGRTAALLGGRLLLAWRLLGLGAALGFVLAADAWLRRAGLPDAHRLPALMLIGLAGGFGGLLHTLQWPPRLDPIDLSTGLFPLVELLGNPHFVCGTTLLMAALLLLLRGGRRATVAGLALAAVAGLTRPYDMVMVVAVYALTIAVREPFGQWPRRLLPLLALLPVAGYLGWVFYGHGAYRIFGADQYRMPPAWMLAVALGPALALAVAARPWPAPDAEAARARAALWCWVGMGIAVVALRPVSFSLQFLAGIGVPLLALGALGLARWRPAAILAALLVLGSTAFVALRVVSADRGAWFAPLPQVQAAHALAPACRPGDVVVAPREIGLYALAFSPCSAYVSHPVMRDAAVRAQQVAAFYTQWNPALRSLFLDATGARAVVLPVDDGAVPASWLGPATPFRRVSAGPGFAIYARAAAAAPAAAP